MPKKKTRPGGRKPGAWTHVTPEQIREYRASNKLSRVTLAALLGVSSTTIVNWETGKGTASLPTQARLRDLLSRKPLTALVSRPTLRPSVNGEDSSGALEAVGKIVAAYLQGTKIDRDALPGLIKRVRAALA